MTTVRDIMNYFEEFVPSSLKMEYDNVGLLVGTGDAEVTKVLVSLDITSEVIHEGLASGAQLIVSHHPIIFSGIQSVTDLDPVGRKIIALIKNGMSAICLHTNLDFVAGGVSDALIAALGADGEGVLEVFGATPEGRLFGAGRIGALPGEMSFGEFLEHAASALKAEGLRYRDAGRRVKRIGVCGGSGGEFLEKAALLGCDTYLTSDIKYDRFIAASELRINIVDGGHYCTENLIVPVIADMLRGYAPELIVGISELCMDPAAFWSKM